MKRLWRHIIHCKESETCTVQHCVSSRYVLTHFYHCKEKGCAMCRPLREVVAKSKRISTADIEVSAAGMDASYSFEALRRLMGAPSQNITCKIALAENSVALFVSLFQFPSRCEETGRHFFPFLNIFMEHPDFDINGKFVSWGSFFITPLRPLQAISYGIVESLREFDLQKFRVWLRGAEILLDAGADANLGDRQYLAMMKHFAEQQLAAELEAKESFHNERGKYWDEAITLFERY